MIWAIFAGAVVYMAGIAIIMAAGSSEADPFADNVFGWALMWPGILLVLALGFVCGVWQEDK